MGWPTECVYCGEYVYLIDKFDDPVCIDCADEQAEVVETPRVTVWDGKCIAGGAFERGE